VSSLGHSVIIPSLLGWHIDQSSDSFLVFLVAVHAATALALVLFYAESWRAIIAGFFRSVVALKVPTGDTYARLAWLIIIGTIPAGALGLLLQKKISLLLNAPTFIALILVANGVLLLLIEYVFGKKRSGSFSDVSHDARIAPLSYFRAFLVGCVQCSALIPGFSRTGATIGGGLAAGLSHEDAARFSFLLSTPLIGAAALLKLPELATHYGSYPVVATLVGAATAALAAYCSVRYLTKYFKTKNLVPFAFYCIIAGVLSILYFLFVLHGVAI
jgi:undecaprenyl-diphosphatase